MKAIFLDRDGTINQDSEDYIKNLQEFQILPKVPQALQILCDAGFKFFIITNQSGIGRGYFTVKELDEMHKFLVAELEKDKISILDIYYCPHLPAEECECRKPNILNVTKAAQKYDINLTQSWFIGDSEKDIITGIKANCKTALVLTGIKGVTAQVAKRWSYRPDIIADNLLDAAQQIISLE